MHFIKCKPKTLTAKEALIYSLLVRRFNVGKAASRRWLATQTGINRIRTLPGILGKLRGHGLLAEHTRTRALAPRRPIGEAANFFYWKTKHDEQWWKRFSFFRLTLRSASSPLSQEQNVVYWRLVNLTSQGRTWQTYLGLSALLHLSRLTVKRAIERLVAQDLVEIEEVGKGFKVSTALPAHALAWFASTGPQTQKVVVGCEAKARTPVVETEETPAVPRRSAKSQPITTYNGTDWRTTMWCGIIESITKEDPNNKWLQQVFPIELYNAADKHYLEYWRGNHDWNWLAHLVADARRQHAKTGQSRTCAYLVLNMLHKAVEGAGQGFETRVRREEEPDMMEEAARRIDDGAWRMISS